jgi:quinol monooxygenase YgiN
MGTTAYTLAMYRVRPGHENAFLTAWRELARLFSSLTDPPLWGTLIRSTADPALFYSFGPWRDPAHVQAMRSSPAASEAFRRIGECCAEVTPGDYELVEHVEVGPRDG